MKKIIILVVLLFSINSTSLLATPYNTAVPTGSGDFNFVNSLYEVGGNIPFEFTNPQDLYIDKNDSVYVADMTQVVKFNKDGTGTIIGEDVLKGATGIFVDNNLDLYVADQENKTVYVFDEQGNLNRQYDRPEEIYFGEDTPYKPIDVAVNQTGKIYIASSGTTDGLITLDQTGKFLGFFGANESNKSIYSSKQMNSGKISSFFRPKPTSISNITIDSRGLVYTLTPGKGKEVRQLNYASKNLLEDNDTKNDELVDVYVDQYGNILTLNAGESNEIKVVAPQGKMMFGFGDYRDTGNQVTGLFDTPSAIAIDSNQVIYAADSAKKVVQTYIPNELALNLYEGVYLYTNGKYEEAEPYFKEILQVSSSYPIAYDNNGMAAYKNKEYSEALYDFAKSGNKERYSDSFYYIREQWLNKYFITLVFVVIIILIIYKLIRKYKIIDKIVQKNKILKSIQVNINKNFLILKKPIYTYYLLKFKDYFSAVAATITYIAALLIIICYFLFTSYLFSPVISVAYVNILNIVIVFIFINAIFQICNYMISRIMYGEGNFKQMYIANSLVYMPLIILLPITIIISKFLTYNEASVYYGIMFIMGLWMFFLIFAAIGEIHNYFPNNTIRNILITIFTIIVIITITITFIYLVVDIIIFVKTLIKEVVS